MSCEHAVCVWLLVGDILSKDDVSLSSQEYLSKSVVEFRPAPRHLPQTITLKTLTQRSQHFLLQYVTQLLHFLLQYVTQLLHFLHQYVTQLLHSLHHYVTQLLQLLHQYVTQR